MGTFYPDKPETLCLFFHKIRIKMKTIQYRSRKKTLKVF
jgi:hypothetical protein